MIYSTAESLCGEFFAAFCKLPPFIREFMGNRIRFELATENAADLTPSDFERFNEEFKKRFTTGVRYGRSSDKQVLTAEQKSYCREALYACLTFIQCVRWVRVGSPKVFDEGDLVREYPSFGSDADQKELSELLRFRNFAKALLSLLPAGKECKGKILYIAGKLSANKIYSTGKGQSVETTRRVQIYEREAKVVKKVYKRFTKNDPSVCAAKVVKKLNTQTHRLVKTKKERSGSVPSALKKRTSSSVAAGVAGTFGCGVDCDSVAKRPRLCALPYWDATFSGGRSQRDSDLIAFFPLSGVAAPDVDASERDSLLSSSVHVDQGNDEQDEAAFFRDLAEILRDDLG